MRIALVAACAASASVSCLLRCAGAVVNQREIYYRLKARGEAQAERDVKMALLDLVGLLNVPRHALGVAASGKGLVAGALVLHIDGGWGQLTAPGRQALMKEDLIKMLS